MFGLKYSLVVLASTDITLNRNFVMTDNGTGMERSYVHFTSDTDNANLGGV